jgi:hypothetical protein
VPDDDAGVMAVPAAAGGVEAAQLIGDLSVRDPHFRIWWAEHHVNNASYGTKHYQHPTVGDLTLDCDTRDSPDGSGQRLTVLTAEPATPSTMPCGSSPPGRPTSAGRQGRCIIRKAGNP